MTATFSIKNTLGNKWESERDNDGDQEEKEEELGKKHCRKNWIHNGKQDSFCFFFSDDMCMCTRGAETKYISAKYRKSCEIRLLNKIA